MRGGARWAKAVPGQPEIDPKYVEEVVETTRERRDGRVDRVVVITTLDYFAARLDMQGVRRVNWQGGSYILDRVMHNRDCDMGVGVRASDVASGYVMMDVTLLAYMEPHRRPFDYWNAALSKGANPRLQAVTDGRA